MQFFGSKQGQTLENKSFLYKFLLKRKKFFTPVQKWVYVTRKHSPILDEDEIDCDEYFHPLQYTL